MQQFVAQLELNNGIKKTQYTLIFRQGIIVIAVFILNTVQEQL